MAISKVASAVLSSDMRIKNASAFVVTALAALWAILFPHALHKLATHLALVLPASSRGQAPPSASEGYFTEAGTFGSPNWTTRYVTLADLNGDGYPDIVVANRGDYPDLVDGKQGEGPKVPTPSFVCLNDGKGHFPGCAALPTESATSIVAADLDDDGALDLFVPHRDGGQSIILWNDGKGHFPTSTKVAGHCLDPHGRRRRLRWPDIVAARSDAPNPIWFSHRTHTRSIAAR